jgi:hypothetical protein
MKGVEWIEELEDISQWNENVSEKKIKRMMMIIHFAVKGVTRIESLKLSHLFTRYSSIFYFFLGDFAKNFF